MEYFIGMPQTVMANIMMIAMKNKKDIYEILVECEELMKKDMRTNPEPRSNWSLMPKLEPAIIFLSLVADKLDCAVFEFFIEDIKRRKNFVYGIIDYVRNDQYVMWDYGEVEKNGAATFSIRNFDMDYGMTKERHKSIWADMSLDFTKDIFEDGEVKYAISFGNLMVNGYTKYDYSLKGAYLLEESEGELKEFIEEMIASHPEWHTE